MTQGKKCKLVAPKRIRLAVDSCIDERLERDLTVSDLYLGEEDDELEDGVLIAEYEFSRFVRVKSTVTFVDPDDC